MAITEFDNTRVAALASASTGNHFFKQRLDRRLIVVEI